MRSYIKKNFVYILPFLIICILLEILLRNIPNDYKLKREYLDNNSRRIEKLFLGGSHTYYGINPEFISGNAFNASYVSQSIDINYKILKKYEGKWDSLKVIVMSVEYPSLFERLSSSIESWRIKNYNLYFGLQLNRKPAYYSELLTVSFKANIKRIYSYYILKHSYITCTDLGFGYFNIQKDLNTSGEEAARRHTIKDRSKYYEASIGILQSIINFAKKRNIMVIYYTAPAYNSYTSNLDKDQLELMLTTLKDLARKNKNCYYHNFLNDRSFDSTDFENGDHLNRKGAKLLSIKMDSLIIKILSQQKQ